MIDIRRILCPVDYSEFSRRALDHAMAIARWYDATVTVLYVNPVLEAVAYSPVGPMIPSSLLVQHDRPAMLRALRSFALAEAASAVPIELEILEGRPVTEIVERAEKISCDLLVLGTHGHSGFDRLMLGSVAETVLRKASCPVLTVPSHAPDAVPIPPSLFKDILCAVDFSAASIRALNYAMAFAKEADAHLTALHVLELPPGTPDDFEDDLNQRPSLRKLLDDTSKERKERLDGLIPQEAVTYCTIETMLAKGKPHREILRTASEQHAGLIVMGVHGHGGVDVMLFGSTTQQVVRNATCPVLTLRGLRERSW
jgi:nucleotide-binding universal stress UspA family protein